MLHVNIHNIRKHFAELEIFFTNVRHEFTIVENLLLLVVPIDHQLQTLDYLLTNLIIS